MLCRKGMPFPVLCSSTYVSGIVGMRPNVSVRIFSFLPNFYIRTQFLRCFFKGAVLLNICWKGELIENAENGRTESKNEDKQNHANLIVIHFSHVQILYFKFSPFSKFSTFPFLFNIF